ncbi:MAG: hypothetical protein WBW84_01950 [Acidobacteriaceae bacterium]
MDDSYRLKIKVGPHEFEAEGPTSVVQEQFRLFKELIESTPSAATAQAQNPSLQSPFPPPAPSERQDAPPAELNIGKIMDQDGRIVSLTVPPKSAEDAVLLILYGQRAFRGNDSVTGSEIMDGLTTTGGVPVERVDRVLAKIGADGDIIITGERRGKRYRLTNAGVAKARQIAQDLIALMP